MRSKVSVLAILLLTLFGGQVQAAKHSRAFVLGTYSNLKSTLPYMARYKEDLTRYMRSLGYNSVFVETDSNERDLAGMLNLLDSNQIDAVIWDRSWSRDPENPMHYSTGPLSTSIYFKFEAEFSGSEDLKARDLNDSRYWYAAHDESSLPRVGRAVEDEGASYGYAWQATRNQSPGLVYTDMKYRWKNTYGTYSRPNNMWITYQTNPPNFEDQFFYIRYRVKLENIDLNAAVSDTLLSFSAEGYQMLGASYARQSTPVMHSSRESRFTSSLKSSLTVGQLKSTANSNDYITVELRIPYSELIRAGLLTSDLDLDPSTEPSSTLLKLINLNPRLYWHGNCDVSLDYVELEDQIHYNMRTNPERYRTGIYNRLTNLLAASPGNIAAIYPFDEPLQPHFDSFRMVQDFISDAEIDVYTATYDYMRSHFLIDKETKRYYDHLEGYRNSVLPRIVAPDIYPITPDTDFNNPGENFIQNILDTKLHNAYLGSKLYALAEPGRKFYPIVQTFARWVNIGGVDQWTLWILPPYATQKMMNYLPLCYGPNGIYHYRFQSFFNSSGYGDYSAMTVFSPRGVYDPPQINPVTWNALMDSNPKVRLYGEQIQNMTWNGTQTFEAGTSRLNSIPNSSAINRVKIDSDPNAPYSGYIQAGFYTDNEGLLNLMAVNRRANYFSSDTFSSPRFVDPDSSAASFPQANAQDLKLELNKRRIKDLGKYPGFYDPADNRWFMITKNKVSIPLEAGEARLLKLVGTIPEGMRGSNTIKTIAFIDGDRNLAPRAKLTIDRNATLRLAPGAVLRLGRGARLIVKGNLELGEGARVEPSSAVEYENRSQLSNSRNFRN